ncbi:MAG: acetylglutamate kinase [Endomicrobium sp.]|jgi:acetylglutamate kinase|nr:acetylglutamate kinase [Endomicrobium sp.]
MNSLIVVKLGGSLIGNERVKNKFIKELIEISSRQSVILVHGGGPEINELLNKFSITSKFIDGLRFTDKNIISVVEMALSGKVNRNLITALIKNGANAVGISGKDGQSIICKRIKKFGFVGEPVKINKKLFNILINHNFLPVVASIASDIYGNVLNVNADTMATFIAIAFKADKLIFLTDVEGVLDNNKKLLNELKIKDVDNMIRKKIITGGMIPKVKGCVDSIKKGIKEVWIIGEKGSIQKTKGTVIKK